MEAQKKEVADIEIDDLIVDDFQIATHAAEIAKKDKE
jgi:hypothetical protein